VSDSLLVNKVDHIGIAVESIQEALAFWDRGLGLAPGHLEEVPDQKVRVAFLQVGESHLELLEPTSLDSPVGKFLANRGQGIHHICLEVPDVQATLRHLGSLGLQLIDPAPRPGTGGSLVAFVHPKSAHGVLLELMQKPKT
jgi:methylmalonyl-CoA epimerase